jgi:MoaA/NifB/PqqE/SkfB family radical SAM enzyme
MPLNLFYKLIPYVNYADLLYLQGWGEPLLNKDIFEMIQICKDKGKRVGFTTNGMLLTEDTLHKLVDLELDILGISLAGTKAETHNKIRKGTDLKKIVSNLELLRDIKDKKNALLPALHLSYTMLKSNFHELEDIVPIAKRLKAEQIIANNLTLLVKKELFSEALFNQMENISYYYSMLEKIKKHATNENLIFAYNKPVLNESIKQCSENICYSCIISVEGEVSPCVFTSPTLCISNESDKNKKYFKFYKNQTFPMLKMSFGNISFESLTQIWNKEEYYNFRNFFNLETKTNNDTVLSKMPDCCKTCYKRLGV